MKSMTRFIYSFSTLTLLSLNALAAQQGELSTSASVGQFTNTLGVPVPALRKVQVLGVLDALVKIDTPLLAADGVTEKPGVRDNFCVVDTLNGAVKLTFTRTDGEGNWVAKDIEGKRLDYRMLVSPTLNGPLNYIAIGAPVTITSSTTVNGPELCNSGNVSKGVISWTAFVPNITYVDTVVITATPL